MLNVMRFCPDVNFVLPVNKRLNFEVPFRLKTFLNVAGTIII